MNIFKLWKKLNELERTEKEKVKSERMKAAQKELQSMRDNMFSKPCPHRNWKMCRKECAHFFEGSVWWFEELERAVVDDPRCKLWKCR